MSSASKGVLRARQSDRHIRLDDQGRPVEIEDVRQRFGGIDVGASIAGALAALGVTVLLGGIAGSIGTVGYQMDVERGTDTLSLGGLITGLVILVAAFLIGGWVAGRIARYDGGRNGLLTAVWFIVVAAALAAAGAWLGDKYDVFDSLQVPQWFSSNATTAAAVVTGIIAAIVMLAAGYFGGVIGERYHRRADAYLAAEERDMLTHGEPLETVDERGRQRDRTADRERERARAREQERTETAAERDVRMQGARLQETRQPVEPADLHQADQVDLRETERQQAARRDNIDLVEGVDLGTSSSRRDDERYPEADPRQQPRRR